jgi:GNAT superfamily N-acetyltransferase
MKGSATGGVLPPPLELAPPREVLKVRRALPREWVHFRDHHYQDHSLKGDSVAFVGLLHGHAVAFLACVPESMNFVRRGAMSGLAEWEDLGYPTPWASTEMHRQLFREHRTVVHPDCQGMGLAPLLCDAVAKLLHDRGADFTSQTVHPSYGSYRDRSPFWRALPRNGMGKFSHFFVGAVLPDGSTDSSLQLAIERRVRLE